MAVAVFVSCNISAQSLQRLAILPSVSESAGGNSSLAVKTIPVDYYRDAPGASNADAKFNQVYFDGGTEIKLNGKITDRSFENLIQGETPLFLLEPNSGTEVRIKLNPAHPETKTIQKYEVRFKSHTIIGNITDDRNVDNARIILLRWGTDLTAADYAKRAKCLDIMARSKMLYPAADGTLPAGFDKIFNVVYNSIDVNFCNDKTFKTLVDSDYLIINATGALTEQSTQRM